MEAAPINPSDLGLLVGAADVSTARRSGEGEDAVLTADVSEAGMRAMAARLDQDLPAGNEGAGTVVAAGACEIHVHLLAEDGMSRRSALLVRITNLPLNNLKSGIFVPAQATSDAR